MYLDVPKPARKPYATFHISFGAFDRARSLATPPLYHAFDNGSQSYPEKDHR